MAERDLPEGVINANPPGGWESSATADDETADQNAQAIDSPELIESDEPGQGADPDLAVGDDA
ncbi:hypothetical protein AB0N73_10220 [Microbacterium sp. NPDC089189]|uniref:hypothetical protein n=1 Tax=Microbacterium sp. NPDC089189 TaxID=3154972 RepID=UPI00342B0077